jgi:hypothetical protein
VFADSAQLEFDDFSSDSGEWGALPNHGWSITGGEMKHYHATDPGYGEIRTHADSSSDDYSVRAKLKSADGFAGIGLVGRFSSSGGTTKFYMAYFSGSYVRLYRYVNGYTQLAYSSFSLPTNEWVDTFLRFEGDEIMVFVNGTKKIHLEDTYGSAPNSGKAGFYSRKGDHRFDDFETIGDDGEGITYEELTSGEPVSTSVKWGYKRYYKIYVADDNEIVSLTIRTYDADQDIDAYVRETTPVNRYTYDFYSAGSTGNEEIRVDDGTSPTLKKDQWYYIMIDGFREFCTYTIEGIVNKRPSVSDVTLTMEDAGIFGRLRIDYKLTDPNADDCNFNTVATQVQHSTDQTNWYDAYDYGTVEGAVSSASGIDHSLSYQPLYWYGRVDKGFESGTSYYVRIKPHDGEDYASSHAVSATALYNNPLSNGDFNDDFDESSQWTVVSGTWDTTGNVYNQTDTTSGYKVSRAGEQSWHNYDICVDAKYVSATAGEKRFGVRFRNNTAYNTFWDFYVEDDGSGWEAKFAYVSGGYRYVYAEHDVTVTSGTWYTFRITLSGDYFTCTFDDQAGLRGTLTGVVDYGGIALWSRGGTYAFDNCFVDTKTTADEITTLASGGSEYNFVAKYQQKFYKITVPANTNYLTVATTRTSDDIDLYLKQGSLPSRTSFDYVSGETSGNETIVVEAPTSGTWYLLVDGYERSEYKVIVEFDDLTVHDGETITFYEDTEIEDIVVQDGGTLILQSSSRITLGAVDITVNNGGQIIVEGEVEIRCEDLTVNSGGVIDGTGRGYASGQVPGAGSRPTSFWKGGGVGGYGGPWGDCADYEGSGGTTVGSLFEYGRIRRRRPAYHEYHRHPDNKRQDKVERRGRQDFQLHKRGRRWRRRRRCVHHRQDSHHRSPGGNTVTADRGDWRLRCGCHTVYNLRARWRRRRRQGCSVRLDLHQLHHRQYQCQRRVGGNLRSPVRRDRGRSRDRRHQGLCRGL